MSGSTEPSQALSDQGTRTVRWMVFVSEPYEGMWIPGDNSGDDEARAIPSFATREEADAYADKLGVNKYDRELLAVALDEQEATS